MNDHSTFKSIFSGRAQIPPPSKTLQQSSSGDKPPKLPPRDTAIYGPTSWWAKGPFDPYSQLPGHASSGKEDSRKKVVKKTSGGGKLFRYWSSINDVTHGIFNKDVF